MDDLTFEGYRIFVRFTMKESGVAVELRDGQINLATSELRNLAAWATRAIYTISQTTTRARPHNDEHQQPSRHLR
jgi:hypothetical protein